MKTQTNIRQALLTLTGLTALILLIIVATALPGANMYQGNLALRPAAATNCSALTLKSIPSPIRSNQSAFLIVETVPPEWNGTLTASASSGLLTDSAGNSGSIINTSEKLLSYGGGEAKSRITVQAAGEGNELCLATITIAGKEEIACTSLDLSSSPDPLLENESAEITVTVTPTDFSGAFLVKTESGSFYLSSADPNAEGENTPTLVTANRKIIYSGGKSGEKIEVQALGEKNRSCKDTLAIEAK